MKRLVSELRVLCCKQNGHFFLFYLLPLFFLNNNEQLKVEKISVSVALSMLSRMTYWVRP